MLFFSDLPVLEHKTKKITITIEDLNSNAKTKRVRTVAESNVVFSLTLMPYHAYVFTGEVNFDISNWTWILRPKDIKEGPRAYFHFKSDFYRFMSAFLRNTNETILLKLFIKFKQIKFLNRLSPKLAIVTPNPTNAKNVSLRLHLCSEHQKTFDERNNQLNYNVIIQHYSAGMILSLKKDNKVECGTLGMTPNHVAAIGQTFADKTGARWECCMWKFSHFFAAEGLFHVFGLIETRVS